MGSLAAIILPIATTPNTRFLPPTLDAPHQTAQLVHGSL